MLKDCILNFAKLLAEHDWYSSGEECGRNGIIEFMDRHSPIRNTLMSMYRTANPYLNGEAAYHKDKPLS